MKLSRRGCGGLILIIYENSSGEFTLLQIEACEHGKEHEPANGDFYKYSCRKIRAVIINDDDL